MITRITVAIAMLSATLPAVAEQWTNSGSGSLECRDWMPKASQIQVGKEFEQVRRCTQLQERGDDTREISVIEKQDAVGTLQVRAKTSYVAGAWENVGQPVYGKWMPAPFDQRSDFVQTRRIRQEVQRITQNTSSDLYGDEGTTVEKTERLIKTNIESRTVNVNLTEWAPVSSFKVCDRWVAQNEDRVRDCRNKEVRYIQYVVDGAEIFRASENRVASATEIVGVDGNQARSSDVSEEGKTVIVEPYNHTPWLDGEGRPMGAQFKDSAGPGDRSYTEYRNYEYIEAWNNVETDQAGKIISKERERQKHQGVETRQVEVKVSGWRPNPQTSSPSSSTICTAWTPAATDVYQGQTANQTRSCTDYEIRDREFYVDGAKAQSHEDEKETQRSESRSVPGQKDPWVYQRTTTSDSWVSGSEKMNTCSIRDNHYSGLFSEGARFNQKVNCDATRKRTYTNHYKHSVDGRTKTEVDRSSTWTAKKATTRSATGTMQCRYTPSGKAFKDDYYVKRIIKKASSSYQDFKESAPNAQYTNETDFWYGEWAENNMKVWYDGGWQRLIKASEFGFNVNTGGAGSSGWWYFAHESNRRFTKNRAHYTEIGYGVCRGKKS